MWIILWLLCGLIGTAIGIKKGYHPIVSLLAGLILGIFSPLMIFISSKVKKCPKCAESVKKEASVCKFCKYEFFKEGDN